MDSGFREFLQTPRGRGFILLEFYTLFKCYMMFRLEIFGTFLVSLWLLETDLGICMIIYGINHVLVSMSRNWP